MDLSVIGERLRRAREARGMSLRDLGAAVRLAPSFLSDVERGRTRPSLESLNALAGALGVALADLVAPDGAGRAAPAMGLDLRRALRDPGSRLTYEGRPLGPSERGRLLQILDAALALGDGAPAGSPREPDVLALAAHMEGEYGRPPSPELVALIRTVVREVREERAAGRDAPPKRDGASGARGEER